MRIEESRLKTLGKPAFEEWAEEEEPTKETKKEQEEQQQRMSTV